MRIATLIVTSSEHMDAHGNTRGAHMNRTRVIAVLALIVGGGVALQAPVQQQGVRRTSLQRHDLSVPGREVIQVRVDIAPGVVVPRHSHPGEEIVYAIEGSLEYRVEGRPPVALRSGDVLFIPAGAVHAVKNVGRGNGAELATYVVEKGKPLLVTAK
jgi:quercetin dioxygenase-like cupin family protein